MELFQHPNMPKAIAVSWLPIIMYNQWFCDAQWYCSKVTMNILIMF